MEHADDLVVALARAYGLSELLDANDERLRDRVGDIHQALEGLAPLELRVDGDAVLVEGTPVKDPHGFVGEMARDLGAAGVERVRLGPEASSGSVLSFLRGLREGAGSGRPARSRRTLEEGVDGIEAAFSGAPAPGDAAGAAGEVEAVFEEAGDASGDDEAEEEDFFEPREFEPGEHGSGAAGAGEFEPGEFESGEFQPPLEDVGDEAAAAGEAGTEPEGDEATRVASPDVPDPDEARRELLALADRYLDADPGGRESLGRELAAEAARLRDEGATEAVADVVERLTAAAHGGTGDPEVLEVAREMVTIAVAARLAVRLTGIREEEERERRIGMVSGLGSPMAEAAADALADTNDRAARRTYIDTLVALGGPGLREAERMIDDGRWFVVRNGVSILGEVGGDRAVEHLTSALGHDDARVRREAVMALAKIGGDDAGDLLVGLVDDPDPDVRAAVAMALGVLKVERAVKPLLQRLEREDEQDVEVQIIRALGALGDPGAVPAIEKRAVASFFSRPPTPLRVAAYKALSDIGTPRASKLLEDAAEDKDAEVRETVQELLRAREG